MEVERVQTLASHGKLHELPSHYIRPAHERPENSEALEGVKVPVISLSQPRELLVKEIFEASKEWGFFVIKDHGVSPDLIKKVQAVGVEFFDQPQEIKEKNSNDPSKGAFEGYGTKMIKQDDQKVEWVDYYFHLMAPPSKVNHDVWPQNTTYREVTEEYNKEVLRLQDEIFRLLSEGLGLEKETLRTHMGGDDIEVEMKINMYPPCPQPELALGVEPHTGMSALTVLVPNDVLGLQCWKDGNWISVDYFPDGIYIHVGDQIEVLSNGMYKSILHRSLVNKEKTRMSWAVFCVPPGQKTVGPLPELVNEENPAKYTAKTFDEYRYRKINKLPQ
uniref:Flavonol synthase n=1 Tax=Fagopyrum tataricum TaxID=62330 RepID=M1GL48_FAGTA|nr:flavonol synthase [Fagopyrum tataricum]